MTPRHLAPKIGGMRPELYLSALIISTPAALYAQQSEEAVYRQLAAGLQEEVRLLSGIVDQDTAQAAMEPLRKVVEALAALNSQINEKELWRYIENTPDIKQPLIEEVERLFVQLQRLEKAKCFHHTELQQLLAPMLNPAS